MEILYSRKGIPLTSQNKNGEKNKAKTIKEKGNCTREAIQINL